MRSVEKKASRLVNTGAVTDIYWRIDAGEIVYAQGTVTGAHGRYTVEIEPDRVSCDCEYGLHQTGRTHSHTRALELAVWMEARESTNGRTHDART